MAGQRMSESACSKRPSTWDLVLMGAVLVGQVIVVGSFDVTTDIAVVKTRSGGAAELQCDYTADFGDPRVEWKFMDNSGSQVFVYYNGEVTDRYRDRVDFSPRALTFRTTVPTDSGKYNCEVTALDGSRTGTATTTLVVEVPPAIPRASIPTSVTTGSSVELRCTETQGYPPPTFRWFRNKILVPESPKASPTFKNSSYNLDIKTGVLNFNPVAKSDSGEYYCEASNGVDANQKSDPPVHMEVYDTNVGGIVAGVIVALLILAFIGIGLWFAYRKGYIGRKSTSSKPKVIYSQPTVADEMDDGDFKQKSSFVV